MSQLRGRLETRLFGFRELENLLPRAAGTVLEDLAGIPVCLLELTRLLQPIARRAASECEEGQARPGASKVMSSELPVETVPVGELETN